MTETDVAWCPTPPEFARWLVALAGVMSGHDTLEPSAGEGAIVQELVDVGALVHVVERDPARRALLHRRGWRGVSVLPVEDFLEMPRHSFDRVVMHPPFDRSGLGDHYDHVEHAATMLRHGGVLVSVLPATAHRADDDRGLAFREWVAQEAGQWLSASVQPFSSKVIILRIVRP